MVGSTREATVSIAIDSSVPQLDVDPYSDDFLADPYPHYVTLREAGPVVWLRPLGVYAVARHAEVASVLRDWETFTTRRGFGLTDMAVDVPLVDSPEYAQFADNPAMNTFGMRMLLDGARPDPPDNAQFRKVFTTLLAPGAVRPLRERFAYVLIDCPPSLGPLTVNALVAAEQVIVPVQTEYFALEGLAQILDTIGLVKRELNPRLTVAGLVLTMQDDRTRLGRDVERDVRDHFPGLVFATVIPRNVRLSEAPSFGVPVTLHDPYCAGSEAYIALAREVAARVR